ncbi:hypothetical protein ACFE04_001824 [Oxalis oulophora]
MATTLGGISESKGSVENSLEIESLARFAVDEHNKKENKILEFARVVKAQEQVVAGTLYYLTVEAIDAGKKKLYEVKIWVKPWMNFKEVQEFKQVGDVPAFTSSDLGVKQEGHALGWQAVPAHDPEVQNAAQHAVKTLQQRSNSLFPYELHEVVDAKAESAYLYVIVFETLLMVVDDSAKFDMLLKLKRGDKEEKYKVEVHKNLEGTFRLNNMQQDHS